jgi:hypothetical protein
MVNKKTTMISCGVGTQMLMVVYCDAHGQTTYRLIFVRNPNPRLIRYLEPFFPTQGGKDLGCRKLFD